ncbi:hypothetical protein VZT92_008160 [Zoarces viviparus]|uniref:Amine oxidase n=1 Tax=Zoarces viviparus TaxID=48416 RepID=A0AAW1FNP4_ZOAVI
MEELFVTDLREPDPELDSDEPEPSCVSLRSDRSKETPLSFRNSGQTPRNLMELDSDQPEPRCMSLRSDRSKEPPLSFRNSGQTPRNLMELDSDQPEPRCMSLRSDRSKELPLSFRNSGQTPRNLMELDSDQPEPRCMSLRSDRSKEPPLSFRNSGQTPRNLMELDSDQPEPRCMSLRSDRSKEPPLSFRNSGQTPREDQESSEVPRGQSAQQHQTHLDSIFMLLEENIVTFVKNELKKIEKGLSSDYPECLESQREDEEVLDGEDEEQRRSSREAFVKITLYFLRRMKQEELADCLQSRLPAPVCQRELKSNLKKKFQCVFEGIAKAGNPTLLNQMYTELYITEEAALRYDTKTPRYLHIASNKTNRWGHQRSYRLQVFSFTGDHLPESQPEERAMSWARYKVAITKHKDSEQTSSSLYSQNNIWSPAVDFSKYIEDNESIEDEDLVAWVTTGFLHIPHSEDIPNTVTVGNGGGVLLRPHNYFDEDPSIHSADGVYIAPGSEDSCDNNRMACLAQETCSPVLEPFTYHGFEGVMKFEDSV